MDGLLGRVPRASLGHRRGRRVDDGARGRAARALLPRAAQRRNGGRAGRTELGVKTERLLDLLFGRARLVLLVASVLAAVCGVRAVLTYANLRSDLEELLPRSAPSVQALEQARRRLRGLRHLGVVVDTGRPENADA